MESFTKSVCLGIAPVRGDYLSAPIYCTIRYERGEQGNKLSISGVHGPKTNGDALGSCGQINMIWRDCQNEIIPADGWSREKIYKFFCVWDDWHLNDMRAYDVEMKAAGWRELARREITRYHFSLTPEAHAEKRDAENAALFALSKGATFCPSTQQIEAANRPYTISRVSYEEPDAAAHGYKLDRMEKCTLGCVYPAEHPDGLLGRSLRPGGNAYGKSWYSEQVPPDVVQFLKSLPEAGDELPEAWRR